MNELAKSLVFWDAALSWKDSLIENNVILKNTKDEYLSGVFKFISQFPEILEKNLLKFISEDNSSYYDKCRCSTSWKENTIHQRITYLRLIKDHALFNINTIEPASIPRFENGEINFRYIKKMFSSARLLQDMINLNEQDIENLLNAIYKSSLRNYFICKMILSEKYPLDVLLELKFEDLINKSENRKLYSDESINININFLWSTSGYLFLRFKEELEKLNVTSQYKLEDFLTSSVDNLTELISNFLEETPVLKESLFFQTATSSPVSNTHIMECLNRCSKKIKLKFCVTPKMLYMYAISKKGKNEKTTN